MTILLCIACLWLLCGIAALVWCAIYDRGLPFQPHEWLLVIACGTLSLAVVYCIVREDRERRA